MSDPIPPVVPHRRHARPRARSRSLRPRHPPRRDGRRARIVAASLVCRHGRGGDGEIRDGRRGTAGRVVGHRPQELRCVSQCGCHPPREGRRTLHIGEYNISGGKRARRISFFSCLKGERKLFATIVVRRLFVFRAMSLHSNDVE